MRSISFRTISFIISILVFVSLFSGISMQVKSWHTFQSDDEHTGFANSASPESCNPLFKFRTCSEVRGSASIFEDCVYFGDFDGNIYSLNSTTGELIWKYETNGSIEATPYVTNDHVYVGSYDGKMYSLHRNSGMLEWAFEAGSAIRGCCAFDGNIYFGTEDGKLYALTSTGTEIWNFSSNDSIGASPVIKDGKVIVGSHDSYLYSIYKSNGTLFWITKLYSMQSSPMLSPDFPDRVYVGSDDGKLYCLNLSNGEIIWTFAAGSPIISTPTYAKDKIYFADFSGHVYAVNATTGLEVWTRSVNSTILSSISFADGKLYFTTLDGFIYCISEQNQFLWRYYLEKSRSSPSIENGIVYVGAKTGLYAFGLGYYQPQENVLRFTEEGKKNFNITLPSGCIVNSAKIYLSPIDFVDYVRAPAIDIGDDGIFDWQFPRPEYGRLGFQDRFTSGREEEFLIFTEESEKNVSFYLPENANVSDARLYLSLISPPVNLSLVSENNLCDSIIDLKACELDKDGKNEYVALSSDGRLFVLNESGCVEIMNNATIFDVFSNTSSNNIVALSSTSSTSALYLFSNGSTSANLLITLPTENEFKTLSASDDLLCLIDYNSSKSNLYNLTIIRNYTTSCEIQKITFENEIYSLDIADLANDGSSDLILIFQNKISILNNASSASIGNSWNYTNLTFSSQPLDIDFADVDLDGMLDFAVVTSTGELLIFRYSENLKNPSVIKLLEKPFSINTYSISLNDLNGDSYPDVVGLVDNAIFICINLKGSFTENSLSYYPIASITENILSNITKLDTFSSFICASSNGTLYILEASPSQMNPQITVNCANYNIYSDTKSRAEIEFTDHISLDYAFEENNNSFEKMVLNIQVTGKCSLLLKLAVTYNATLHTGNLADALNYAILSHKTGETTSIPASLYSFSPGEVLVNWTIDYDFPPVVGNLSHLAGNYEETQAIFFNISATDPDGDDLTFNWYSNISGFLSNMPNFTLALPPGVHEITLNVTDAHNHTVTRSVVIVVNKIENNPPVIVISKPNSNISSFPFNTLIEFDASASYDTDGDSITFLWTSNISGIIGDTSTFSFALSVGTHLINLTISDGKTNVSTEFLIVVLPPPYLAPSINIVEPNPSLIENQALKGIIYINGTASFPSGNIRRVDYRIDGGPWLQASGDSSWSILWNTSKQDNGNHTIEVRAYDGISYSEVKNLKIIIVNNNPPKADFTIKNKVNVGESIQFDGRNSADSDGDTLTYTWIFGDGEKLNGIVVKHAYSKPGRYNITLIVNDTIDSNSLSQQISVVEKASSSKVPAFSAYLALISFAFVTLATYSYRLISKNYISSGKSSVKNSSGKSINLPDMRKKR